MTPRVVPRVKDGVPTRPRGTSFRIWRPTRTGSTTDEEHAFWNWAMAPPGFADNARDWLPEHEYRVLSKAASGGGFLVPTDVSEPITAAARAASAVAQVALAVVTARGETIGVPLADTHGSASWVAESGSYTASDETITNQNMGSFEAGTKIFVSEELRSDEAVELDAWLANELGGRLGALHEAAFTTGDGSGKPLGLVHASSPYTVVNAATGSSTEYKPADLEAVYKTLPAGYRANAAWLMAADDFGSLAGLMDTAGGLVFASLHAPQPPCSAAPSTSPPTCRPRPRPPSHSCSLTSGPRTASAGSKASRCSGRMRSRLTVGRWATGLRRGSTAGRSSPTRPGSSPTRRPKEG